MNKNPLGISIGVGGNRHMAAEYARAGFEVAEISLADQPFEERRAFALDVMAQLRECGMTLWSVHLPFSKRLDISELDEEKRLAVIRELTLDIELARELGAQVLVIHGSSEPNPDEERADRLAASIRSLAALQAIAGDMKLAIENLPRTCIGRTGAEVDAMSCACSGICFDVNHLLIESHSAFLSAAAPHVITTHLSDYDGLDERHFIPGAGIVPWKLVRSTLLENGYTGPFLFELRDDPATSLPYPPADVLAAWADCIG